MYFENAGTLGFEPRTKILEIFMMPFHHVPLTYSIDYFMI